MPGMVRTRVSPRTRSDVVASRSFATTGLCTVCANSVKEVRIPSAVALLSCLYVPSEATGGGPSTLIVWLYYSQTTRGEKVLALCFRFLLTTAFVVTGLDRVAISYGYITFL